jgi:ribonuclease HII
MVDRPDLRLEVELHQSGYQLIAGIDEAGRGAWAGPVVAGAIILPLDRFDLANSLHGVRDSKVLSAKQRRFWDETLKRIAISWKVGVATAQEVDTLGLISATRLAMRRAIESLEQMPEFLLIDHLLLTESSIPQTALPRGDVSVLSISAASILAKVARDQSMLEFEKRYPGYGFSRHKGYGTPEHRHALKKLGPCPLHRRSFQPIVQMVL